MQGNYSLYFKDPSSNNSQYNENNMPISSAGISTYNSGSGASYYFDSNNFQSYNSNSSYSSNPSSPSNTTVLQMGPGTSNNNYNPSAEYLNLDLTPNTAGKEGGSHAFNNYNPSGSAGFNTMTGSKARITYLNLPTLIFDPSNIQIKAKAVHGN